MKKTKRKQHKKLNFWICPQPSPCGLFLVYKKMYFYE